MKDYQLVIGESDELETIIVSALARAQGGAKAKRAVRTPYCGSPEWVKKQRRPLREDAPGEVDFIGLNRAPE